jgi:glycosyltransferase involved in cell wall biosynthesis
VTGLKQTTGEGATLSLSDALMIVWRKECYRSSATARTFDVPIHYVWYDLGSSKLGLLLRYLRSFWRTLEIVWQEKPRLVVAINLPPLLPLALLVARLFNPHQIVLDFHSGALTNPVWRPFLPLYRLLVRTSPFTVNHNRFDAEVIRGWGGHPVYLIVLPRIFEGVPRLEAPRSPKILAVCSFAPDEPIDLLLEAMALCPEVEFAISGNYERAGVSPEAAPSNVHLLGFLEYQEYLRVMAASTAIITLSNRPNIMQMAIHEAVSLGLPVITNESETLSGALDDAGVFCALEAVSLANAIHRAVSNAEGLRKSASELLERRQEEVRRELRRVAEVFPGMFDQDRSRVS